MTMNAMKRAAKGREFRRRNQRVIGALIERLEGRRMLAFAAALAGTEVSFVGDEAGDLFILSVEAGSLKHNRFSAGDAGFVSDLDMDSEAAGEQMLAADATTRVNIDGGDGADTFIIRPINAAGSVSVGDSGQAEGDADILILHGTSGNDEIEVTADDVAMNGGVVSLAGGLEGMTINLGSGDDILDVFGLSIPATIGGGSGNDIFGVDTGLGAPLSIRGGSGRDYLDLFATTGDDSLSIGNNRVTGHGSAIAYGAIGLLSVFTLSGDDSVVLGQTGVRVEIHGGVGRDLVTLGNDALAKGGVLFNGGAGKDTLVINGSALPDRIAVLPDRIRWQSTFSTRIMLVDRIHIDGGDGDDFIDASRSPKPVALMGGQGADTLIGSRFDDRLEGGPGNDSLVGGPGADTLPGQEGNDLLGSDRRDVIG